MSTAAAKVDETIQADWEEREFTKNITDNIQQIVEFLNQFEIATKYRLATINEKLTIIERQVSYLEGAVATAGQ